MEAALYQSLPDQKVRCNLCNHRCVIKPEQRGLCGVRENQAGVLVSLVYGRLIASHIDPIEKKPFFHFLPGSRSFSIATVGCNFSCRFCQNADIAQMPADRNGLIMGETTKPEAVVAAARRANCHSIAYTYTEPTVYFELVLETAKIAHHHGLENLLVTNGYMSPEALEQAAPFIDGANVDLKAFNDLFYRTQCGARLEPVKETLRLMRAHNLWVEVTTLIVPGLNDDPTELSELADFLCRDLGTYTPWHVSRFHPTYHLTDRSATPVATLQQARQIGIQAGLQYVYTGNVPGDDGENTRCPGCGKVVVERWGFQIQRNSIRDDRCSFCGAAIAGVGMSAPD